MAKFQTGGLDDALNIIIPFFEKYPLLGNKSLDFQDYRTVALMMREGLHLTPEGLERIKNISAGMNTKRDYSFQPTLVVPSRD